MVLDGKEKENSGGVRGVLLVQFLFVFVESVKVFFSVESVETEHVEGSDKLPVG